jgi:type IV pilus assembly protein PilA
MLHKLRQRAQDEKGFTLIELLVVILIIGILAAIALPAFLNQRTKAQDTEAKSKARTAQTALETYYVNEQTYVGANLAALTDIEPSLADGPTLAVSNQAADTWTVTVTSKTTGTFTIAKTAPGGVPHVDRTCGPAAYVGKGGCPSTGHW